MPKKVCPGCANEVGPRTLICPNCNHAFFSSVKADPSVPMEAVKTVPERPVAAPPPQELICKVVQKPVEKPAETKPAKPAPAPAYVGTMEMEARAWSGALGWTGDQILVPAGKCPIPLKEITQESVQEWVEAMSNLAYKRESACPGMLSPNAMRYFLRTLYQNDDYTKAVSILNDIVKERIGNVN